MGMCAVDMDARGELKKSTVVATVMSNLGLEKYFEKNNIKLMRAKVGDRYVVEKMLSGDYNFGGEQSGHIIFLDYNTTGDGQITAMQVLNLMKNKNVSLSRLASPVKLFPQVLMNVEVGKITGYKISPCNHGCDTGCGKKAGWQGKDTGQAIRD